MNIESKNEASSDLPPEFVNTARYFYKSAAECVKRFRDLRDATNIHGRDDAAELYADAHADLINAYHLVLKLGTMINASGDKGQIATFNHALEDIYGVIKIIDLNNEMILVRFESYSRRRAGGGPIDKIVGILSNVKGIGVKAFDKGMELAGKGKRMVDRGVVSIVRGVVPRPVRKAVSWVGQIGEDVQDFWNEVF